VEDEESLRQAVEAQAAARVAGDIATFASYVTPQALLRLHRQGETLRAGTGVRRYEVLDITKRADGGSSDVRYIGSGSYVLRTRWERRDGLWKAVMVEMPPELAVRPWWRRVLRLERRGGLPPVADRRDLR
jgi:hypothetical protein